MSSLWSSLSLVGVSWTVFSAESMSMGLALRDVSAEVNSGVGDCYDKDILC